MNISEDISENTSVEKTTSSSQQEMIDNNSDNDVEGSECSDNSSSDEEFEECQDNANDCTESKLFDENESIKSTNNDDASSKSSANISERRVKLKVKRQMQKVREKQKARRIRKAGEAAVATKARRDNYHTVKDSFGWD